MSFAIGACGGDGGRGSDSTGIGTEASSSDESGAPSSETGIDTDGESGGTDGTGETGDTGGDPYYGPIVYPPGSVHSPIPAFVGDNLRGIADGGADKQDDVFMQAGASSTVSPSSLDCFDGDTVDLDAAVHLQDTLDLFLAGNAAGTSPFGRQSLAAEVGRTAGWAIAGNPTPLESEIAAIDPQLGFVHYGTNDMGFGATYASALRNFYANEMQLIEIMLDEGIVPIVSGITFRGDNPSAQQWVATYNAVIRGMAQAHQVPFVDLYEATVSLPGHGLSGDGLHPNAFGAGACVLTSEGLEYGYNVRNLISLEVLDRLAAVVIDGVEALDDSPLPRLGDGSPADPIELDGLPFVDFRDTARSPDSNLDGYPACGSDADESGPELLYRYEVESPIRIRAGVLDRELVDVDLHLLDESGTAAGCLYRDDSLFEVMLDPGVYTFALDTWVMGGMPLAGEYLFFVVECDPDDDSCG